jgi:hypothetical protein
MVVSAFPVHRRTFFFSPRIYTSLVRPLGQSGLADPSFCLSSSCCCRHLSLSDTQAHPGSVARFPVAVAAAYHFPKSLSCPLTHPPFRRLALPCPASPCLTPLGTYLGMKIIAIRLLATVLPNNQ